MSVLSVLSFPCLCSSTSLGLQNDTAVKVLGIQTQRLMPELTALTEPSPQPLLYLILRLFQLSRGKFLLYAWQTAGAQLWSWKKQR